MKSERTRGHLVLRMGVVVGAVLAQATAASSAPRQSAYDGHLEEANAWAIEQVNAPAAWEVTRGGGVTIAVVDTGMGDHPFFEDKDVQRGYSTVSGDEEDAWYDWSGDPSDPDDRRGHGAGVAAMALLAAPEATILPVRHGTGDPDQLNAGGETEADHEAIRWAADNGADVIALAWGTCCTEAGEDFYMAIQYAIDKGAVVVAAAGNEPETPVGHHYAAAFPGVVTVSGSAADGGAWETSSVGPEVDVAGPADYSLAWPLLQNSIGEGGGHDRTVLDDGSDEGALPLYVEAGGTSSATGWVAGVVALVRAAHPDLDEANVVERLIQTAQDRGTAGHDEVFGHGIVDAGAAVTADVGPVEANPLGYPLGIRGASGVTATGEPAPGSGATSSVSSGSGSDSDLVPLLVVAALAAALAGGTWFLVLRRTAGPVVQAGGSGSRASASPVRVGLLVAVAAALVAGGGTYVAIDALVQPSDAGETTGAAGTGTDGADAADGDGADGDAGVASSEAGDVPAAEEVGQTAADGSGAAAAAQAWQDANTDGDLEAFRSLTCADPWYRVVINIEKLEDPSYVRPGFTLLFEDDEGWEADDYRLMRQSDGKAWVEAGNLSIGSNAIYEIALVMEDGEWKVCDFWMTGPSWQGHPEWEARFPRGDGDTTTEVFRAVER